VLSFVFLHDIDPNIIGIIEAFAAGAILAMLADTMMPEAYEEGGFLIGILTVLGFLTAFIISRF
jgi:ZIP family zinc transporter